MSHHVTRARPAQAEQPPAPRPPLYARPTCWWDTDGKRRARIFHADQAGLVVYEITGRDLHVDAIAAAIATGRVP